MAQPQPQSNASESSPSPSNAPNHPPHLPDPDLNIADVLFDESALADLVRFLEDELNPGTGFVTINGNEESCGPSFSDSASTVMASFDTSGVVGPPAVGGEDWVRRVVGVNGQG